MVDMEQERILENLKAVYRRIAHAAMRAGREPDEIRLVAVSKTVGVPMLLRAVDVGMRDFGENRVQEAQGKISDSRLERASCLLRWHLIGHLQRNKVRTAVQLFDLIHAVDSAELAAELDRQAGKAGKIQPVLCQVKLSGEETKHGVSEEGSFGLIEAIGGMANLRLEGLMTMPPYFEDPEGARPYFRRLRLLREEAESRGYRLPELSMGMSGDFEVAIEEGATIVRVGTAIFGERSGKAA